MEVGGKIDDSLIAQIDQLQRERDELRKDIEQLCMQQAGPGYLAVATRMHFQRTAGLEQEIESLKKKLVIITRDKKNLEEELFEVYHIKSQLADLHSAEVLKNKEAEKQLKFFQSCVAAAFVERDHSLMESEKAKEHEEALSQKLIDSENRVEELQSAYLEEKKLNAILRTELENLREQREYFDKVVNKFYEIRERESGISSHKLWRDKCSCLLDDLSDKWNFSVDDTPASKYTASLEELGILQKKIDELQSNMRMGLEIEQHLHKNLKSMEKNQAALHNLIGSGVSMLRQFHNQYKFEVINLLDEEMCQMKLMLVEIEKTMTQSEINSNFILETIHKENEHDITECRDVHMTVNANSSISYERDDSGSEGSATKKEHGESEVLSQALQEKVAALLLLSQQEERHRQEKEVNKVFHQKVEDLQRSLTQATNEKVKALMELAQLKQHYQQLLGNNDGLSGKHISDSEQEGRIRNLLRRTYLKRWIGKDAGVNDSDLHGNTIESNHTNRRNNCIVNSARLKVENVALEESMSNLEHLTSSAYRLRLSLVKAQEAARSTSSIALETVMEALDGIIAEANQVKTALNVSLPVSWSADFSDPTSLYGSLYESSEPAVTVPKSERLEPVLAAGMEMMELLIIAAQLLKDFTMCIMVHSTVLHQQTEPSVEFDVHQERDGG